MAFQTKKSCGERRAVHLQKVISMGANHMAKPDSLSTNEELFCCALLLVVSNHFPASLLSPELCLFERSFGDALGGLALSLAGFGELNVVGWRSSATLDSRRPTAGGLCRRETDRCAGGRRGCWRTEADGIVPGGSFMSGIDAPWWYAGYG